MHSPLERSLAFDFDTAHSHDFNGQTSLFLAKEKKTVIELTVSKL